MGWLVANGVVAATLAGPLFPRAYVILVFVAGSLPLGWSAWMFSWPRPMRLRAAVLAALLPLPVAAGLLLKADGLTGDGQLNFAWRWTVRDRHSAPHDRPAMTADPRHRRPIRVIETPDDYPQFLGPQRQAVVPGARLAGDWQAGPPRTLWRQGVGAGWGSLAVVGEYAFTQEQRGDDECVVCYRVATGEEIWRHADRQSFESTAGLGPRATPTVAGNRVFTLGATGLLNCLEAPTGRPLWSVNILADNRAQNLAHGLSGSPLVADDLVIVSPTGSNGISLAAYRQQTGQAGMAGGQLAGQLQFPDAGQLRPRPPGRALHLRGRRRARGPHRPGPLEFPLDQLPADQLLPTRRRRRRAGPTVCLHRLWQRQRAAAHHTFCRGPLAAAGPLAKPVADERFLHGGGPRGLPLWAGRRPVGLPRRDDRPPALEAGPV